MNPAGDDVIDTAERALAPSKKPSVAAWDDLAETAVSADALADEETRDRLREFGYLE